MGSIGKRIVAFIMSLLLAVIGGVAAFFTVEHKRAEGEEGTTSVEETTEDATTSFTVDNVILY